MSELPDVTWKAAKGSISHVVVYDAAKPKRDWRWLWLRKRQPRIIFAWEGTDFDSHEQRDR